MREEEERREHTVGEPRAGNLQGAASEWLSGRPRRSRQIPQQARAVRGEKGGAEIEELPSYPIQLLRPPPSRSLPEIQVSQNPRAAEQLTKLESPLVPALGIPQVRKFTRRETKNGSR